jgi:molybdopterin-guanine dinucleotide biosynthesis protein A
LRKIGGYDVIVPKTRDGLQPLHAIYSKKCLEPIKKIILQNKFKILDLYPIVRVKIILEKEFSDLDPANESFINVNTPEDLDLIRKRW